MATMSIYRLRELLDPLPSPCLSIYEPTHRSYPDRQQDAIRFRNLVSDLDELIRRNYPESAAQSLLEPFRALADDRDFWNFTQDGLAVFGAAGFFQAFRLQRSVPELAVAAESMHVKPLVRFVQSADRYQVLCLSRDDAKLYEGNRDALDPIELAPEIPRSNAEAMGEEATNKPARTVVSYGGMAGGEKRVRGGQGSEKDVADLNAERFFRAVDRGVLEHHSRPSGLPLVLVSADENHELFRRVSHNPLLAAEGVKLDPASLSVDRLRDEVWKVVQPHYLKRLAELVEGFEGARSKFLGSDDVADIARAAVAGRVGTLLVDADKLVPGAIDHASGAVRFDDLSHPKVDDLLDDLAELVLRKGGEVVVAPAGRMPTESGAAAIYRF
jgi:Bacterial archaeo-eukaryotic release factor family 3